MEPAALSFIRDRVNDYIAFHEQRINYINHVRSNIENATKHFMETGVAVITPGLKSGMNGLFQTPDAYFRQISKELGLIPIIAEYEPTVKLTFGTRKLNSTVGLFIPKQKRLNNVVAPLILIAERYSNVEDVCSEASPVGLVETKGKWWFYFNREGHEQFKHFLNRCKTDRITRITLNLPPLPQGVTT